MTFTDRLESLAAKATKGEWRSTELRDCVNEGYYVVRDGCEFGRAFIAHTGTDNDSARDADYIAFVNPAVGLAVARALRAAEALDYLLYESECSEVSELRAALAALDAMEEA